MRHRKKRTGQKNDIIPTEFPLDSGMREKIIHLDKEGADSWLWKQRRLTECQGEKQASKHGAEQAHRLYFGVIKH